MLRLRKNVVSEWLLLAGPCHKATSGDSVGNTTDNGHPWPCDRSDFCLLCHLKSIIDLNSKISYRALDF